MSLFALVQAGCLIAFAALLLVAAWQDLRTMSIADRLSLGVAAAFLVWALAGLAGGTLSWLAIGWAVACALGVFAGSTLLFAIGALGGGDVKLLAVASLFAGPGLMADFIMVTALAGGLLGVAVMAGAPIGPLAAAAGETTLRTRLRRGLPYGPAIAAGGLWIVALLVM